MARYDVRFQLQARGLDIHDNYHSETSPCSKREALEHLAGLWAKGKTYYSDAPWNRELKEAIEKAERAVNSASNVSASEQRNFYSKPFDYDGTSYRIDIAVESGSGHFN